MATQFHWSSKRQKAALALAEGQSQQARDGFKHREAAKWLLEFCS